MVGQSATLSALQRSSHWPEVWSPRRRPWATREVAGPEPMEPKFFWKQMDGIPLRNHGSEGVVSCGKSTSNVTLYREFGMSTEDGYNLRIF